MKNKIGIICMVLGALLVLGALSLFLYNENEAEQAEQASNDLLEQIKVKISEQNHVKDSDQTPPETTPNVQTSVVVTDQAGEPMIDVPIIVPDPLDPATFVMTEVEIDGYNYIGYLSIPDLGLELPIMTDWSYPQLKIAPCRYMGTVKGDDLVLLAHNYSRHFGKLKNLTTGASIYFTDMDGVTTEYAVVTLETLQPTAVESVTQNDYDLTLFTCTYGGRTRVTVYCDKVENN